MSTGRHRFGDLVGRGDYVPLVYALVLVWGFGDVLSTFLAAWATGPAGHELNPLVASMLAVEPLLVVALKAGVVLLAGTLLLAYRDVVVSVPGWWAWFGAVILAGSLVVANNTVVALVA
jgi:hypothetical protein